MDVSWSDGRSLTACVLTIAGGLYAAATPAVHSSSCGRGGFLGDEAKYRVPRGFGPEGLHPGGRTRVEERAGDGHLGRVAPEHATGLLRVHVDDRHRLATPAAAERDPPGGSGIAHPADLAVGRHEPAGGAVLDQRHRRPVEPARGAPPHAEEVGVARAQPHAEQGADYSVDRKSVV